MTIAIAAVLAGVVVQTIVRVKVLRRGGSILREWALGCLSFVLTIAGIWALYLVIGNLAI